MAERPWSKDWRAGWRDERLDDCGAAAVALRPCMSAHVVDVDEDGTGWVQNLDGRPMSVAQLARLVRHDEAAALAGLEQLRAVKIAVRREDGCWGILGWQRTQESPEAARVRRHRAARAAPAVTPDETLPHRVAPPAPVTPGVTPPVTVGPRGGEERGERTEIAAPSAGAREESAPPAGQPAPRRPTPATLGQRLALARELVGHLTPATAAVTARIGRSRYMQLEADEALPDRDELARIARTLGQPEIADWPIPERDLELVAAVVRQHHDLAVELGAADPALRRDPLVVTPLEVATVYAAELTDAEAGLDLGEGWARVLRRAAEQLRRELARGRLTGRQYFTLRSLAGKRRADLLATADLDRRDDLTPPARAPPRGRRGPAPPVNPDRLTHGEIPG